MVMMVNGYMCYSSCQVAAARTGKDPHTPLGAPPNQSSHKNKADGHAGQRQAILDPGNQDRASAMNPARAAGAANSGYPASKGINRLV